MSATLEVNGTSIGIEVDAAPGQHMAGLAETIKAKWADASTTIKTMAVAFHATLVDLSEEIRPESVEIEFGLKLTNEADWVIGKTSGEAHIDVKLSYTLRPQVQP